MFDLRQDERTFWKTMNPCRLHALFDVWFSKREKKAGIAPGNGPGGKPTQYIDFDEPITEQRNLAEYFTKG